MTLASSQSEKRYELSAGPVRMPAFERVLDEHHASKPQPELRVGEKLYQCRPSSPGGGPWHATSTP